MVRDSGVLKVAPVVGVVAALLGGVLAYFFVSQGTQDGAVIATSGWASTILHYAGMSMH